MNDRSAWEPRRIIRSSFCDVLGQLDAVPVRIEDGDALVAQAGRGRLHVVDVDHRNAALALRLAFRQRDPHLAELELGPAVVPVDVRLFEAQEALVEVPAAVELADEVPHARFAHNPSAGSSRYCLSVAMNWAACAPSTARWSTVRVIVITGRTTTAPSRATGVSTVAPTARIAACGGLRTAMNCSTPNMPRFEIVKVPPSRSRAVSLLSRARPTTSPRADASSASDSRSTLRTTGTTSPCGAATAIPMSAVGNRSSASSVYWTLTSGWRTSAWAESLARRSVSVTRTSGLSSRTRATSSFARVMSALTVSWKTGACQAAVRRRAIVLRI